MSREYTKRIPLLVVGGGLQTIGSISRRSVPKPVRRFRQKIEVATLPTVADLKARRLELTKATVREYLVGGDFADVRDVVESLAGEFDVHDIAAAAIKMAHAASARAGDEPVLETPPRTSPSDGGVARAE